MRWPAASIAALGAGLAIAACGGGGQKSASVPSAGPDSTLPPAPITLTSPAFDNGTAIPRQYTCDGRDISPPLSWSDVPHRTRRLQLTVVDVNAPGGHFIHWSIAGIPATTSGTQAGVAPSGTEGRNGFGTVGYRGPCPPPGDKPHHYVITITALAGRSTLASGALVGTYARG